MRQLLQLFWIFFKIGALTFGSGYAMISIIENEVVTRKHWFDREDFIDHLTLAQSAPGPIALNAAVFTGYRVKGIGGAAASVLGATLPSFIIILLIAVCLSDFRNNAYVNAAFNGLRPCVLALIAVPCVRLVMSLKGYWQILLAVASLALIAFTGISPVLLLIAGAAIGLILTCFGNSKS